MKRPEKKSSLKIDFYILLTAIAGLILLGFRIPLGYLAGDNGVAYFATANEIFVVFAGAFAYALSEAMTVLVRYRIKREQFKSVQKLLRCALLVGIGAGVAGAAAFFLFGQALAEAMQVPHAGLAVCVMPPAILFMILTGVFRGFFQGHGSKVLSMHSRLLYAVLLTAGGLLGTELMYAYGEKVSALLQNNDFQNAYGAMGAAIGIVAASFFCFLHAGVIYLLYRNAAVNSMLGRDAQRSQDTPFQILRILLGTGSVYALYWLVFCGKTLADQLCFFRIPGEGGDKIGQWGAYYGKYMPVCGILSGLICLPGLLQVRRVVTLWERQEYRAAREKLAVLLHQCAVICIPAAVFLAVLADNVADVLFSGNNRQVVGWIQWGSILVAVCPFAVIFSEMLSRGKKQKSVAGIGFAAMAVHIGIAAALLNLKMGIAAVIIANAVFCLVLAGAEFWIVCRSYQYRQEWIRTFAVTIVASALSGVIAMLLNMAFAPMLGKAISLLIALLAAIPVYMILLLAARAFKEEELEGMSGGRMLLALGRLLHFR